VGLAPSLERLDLSGMHRFDAPDDIILRAARTFPRLAYICLPVVWSVTAQSVAKTINRAMLELDNTESSSPSSSCQTSMTSSNGARDSNMHQSEKFRPPMHVVVQLDPAWDVKSQGWRTAEDIPLSPENREACLESLSVNTESGAKVAR